MKIDLIARARDIGVGHADRLLTAFDGAPTLEIVLEAEHELVDTLDGVQVTGAAHDALVAVARFAFLERLETGEGAHYG